MIQSMTPTQKLTSKPLYNLEEIQFKVDNFKFKKKIK